MQRIIAPKRALICPKEYALSDAAERFIAEGSGRAVIASSAGLPDIYRALMRTGFGDTVICPAAERVSWRPFNGKYGFRQAGAVSWSGGVTVSGKNLIGPGKDAGSPTTLSAGLVTITKHASEYTRLIGFRFNFNGQHLAIGGNWASKMAILYDNYHYNDGDEYANQTTNGVLWCGFEIESELGNNNDCFRINCGGPGGQGLESWQAASTWGEDDTTGELNSYFEYGTWRYLGEAAIDSDNGARVVVRRCNIIDTGMVSHGGGSGSSGQDTSSYGSRQFEYYNNTCTREENVSVNKWHWQRGGSCVIANNTMVPASFEGYAGKQNIRLSCGCPGTPAYPMAYQVGQTEQTPENPPSEPCLLFGNSLTGVGSGESDLINISGSSGEGISCGSPTTYIQNNRDFYQNNQWGWAPYTDPHPLNPEF